MCSGHARIRRLAEVNSHTLIVFTAPKMLCDYEKLLYQNVRQYAVFPIAHVPASIPLRATVVTRWLSTPVIDCHGLFAGRKNLQARNRCQNVSRLGRF